MSAEQGSSVPGGLLQAHIRRLQPSTPSISQPLPVNCFTTPSQHVWSSGFLRRGSDGMELASRLSPGPCSEYWQFQIGFKDYFFSQRCGTISALEALREALYKYSTTTTTTTTNHRQRDSVALGKAHVQSQWKTANSDPHDIKIAYFLLFWTWRSWLRPRVLHQCIFSFQSIQRGLLPR